MRHLVICRGSRLPHGCTWQVPAPPRHLPLSGFVHRTGGSPVTGPADCVCHQRPLSLGPCHGHQVLSRWARRLDPPFSERECSPAAPSGAAGSQGFFRRRPWASRLGRVWFCQPLIDQVYDCKSLTKNRSVLIATYIRQF